MLLVSTSCLIIQLRIAVRLLLKHYHSEELLRLKRLFAFFCFFICVTIDSVWDDVITTALFLLPNISFLILS